MNRTRLVELVQWAQHSRRKPLLLLGARQVGKTWLLRALAREHFESEVYLNFEENPALDGLFADSLAPAAIGRNIALYTGRKLGPRTLLILDEVQASPRALNSLKYFAEQAPELPVAAAGSLLGVRVSRERSFPVGKVELLELHPLSLLEFLDALGESGLRELIEARSEPTPFPVPLHDKLVGLVRRFLYVGGMPEAVATLVRTQDIEQVRRVQLDILRAYELDFARHAPPRDIPRLSQVWQSIPAHLGRENKKFVFSAVRPGARARDYENAVSWLEDAGLIHKVINVSTAKLPLAAYARRNVFKVYLLDVGLLCAMTRLPASVLVEGNRLFEEFRGALTENLVAQELASRDPSALYYWSSSGGRAELDFLHEAAGAILPLEVKAGVNPRSKSLTSYDAQFSPPALCRANLLNLRRDDRHVNFPLYAISRFPELALGTT